jgi:ERG2 and Sigma1 receptor like protein
MAYVFDPDVLHDIARLAIEQRPRAAVLASVEEQLAARYPRHIERGGPWIFNNAGGAMGQLKLLHCSLSEYILIFGTPIGTEGHSGRYGTQVYDFMLDGEMWCYHAGELEKTVFQPGDLAYLGPDKAKGYACPNGVFMLEYARGVIPSMLPFGLADTLFSTRDGVTMRNTLWQYGKLVVRELMQGKV